MKHFFPVVSSVNILYAASNKPQQTFLLLLYVDAIREKMSCLFLLLQGLGPGAERSSAVCWLDSRNALHVFLTPGAKTLSADLFPDT